MTNDQLAKRLEELADLLDTQHANPFRVNAYRTAARTIQELSQPVAQIIAHEGSASLQRLPGIGKSLARSLERLTLTGRLPWLHPLHDEAQPERVLATVPGIGPKSAARIHEELGIQTLAELEAAAYDGRLAAMPGMGLKKVRAVRDSLAGRSRRPQTAVPSSRQLSHDQPPVAELLDIDEEFRRKATADRLPRVAPRRFNPTGQAWLPILHTHREDRHYTALYSNTARAHELGTTHDWVVIYRDDHDGDGQWTVITSLYGRFKGRRIVRGRESECAELYRA